MYIDVAPNRNSPPAILLREARCQQKSGQGDSTNLFHLSPQRIDILRRGLKSELDGLAFLRMPAVLEQGPSLGALWVAITLYDRLGINHQETICVPSKKMAS